MDAHLLRWHHAWPRARPSAAWTECPRQTYQALSSSALARSVRHNCRSVHSQSSASSAEARQPLEPCMQRISEAMLDASQQTTNQQTKQRGDRLDGGKGQKAKGQRSGPTARQRGTPLRLFLPLFFANFLATQTTQTPIAAAHRATTFLPSYLPMPHTPGPPAVLRIRRSPPFRRGC